MIPLFKPAIPNGTYKFSGSGKRQKDIILSIKQMFDDGYIGQGPWVEKFEDRLHKYLQSRIRPITVNSCTSALDLSLHLIGVGPGDEVISTPMTCFATNSVIINRGAKIVWADINPDTGLINPDDVKKKITSKTKAVMAVNWAGRFCDYKSLRQHGVPVIEDAAHTYDVFTVLPDDQRGDYIAYSFQAIKFLTCGDGGALITPKEKEEEARLLRWYGLDRTKGESFRCTQNIKQAGFKYHMNDIAATIGYHNITTEADKYVASCRIISEIYTKHIDNPKLEIPEYDKTCSYWLFTVLSDYRNEFSDYLTENEISNSPVHYRNDLYDCTKEFKIENLPGVDEFSRRQINIPVGHWLKDKDISYIINTANSFK